MKILKYLFIVVLLLIPTIALAQLPNFPCPEGLRCPGQGGTAVSTVNDFILVVITWLTGIAFGLAVLFLVIGGFRYIIAGGNEESSEAARGTVVNALIGIVVIILSYVIINVVVNTVSNSGVGGP